MAIRKFGSAASGYAAPVGTGTPSIGSSPASGYKPPAAPKPPVLQGDTPTGTKPAAAPAAPTVQAPGAPPGVPNTSIPLIPKDEQAIQYANQDYGTAEAGLNQGMGQAAFRYGDPTQMARFGVGSINPNSDLALAALRAQQQQEAATGMRGRANTLFSSLALEDRARIGATQQRAQLAGNTRYQGALARFNAAMLAAQTARDRTIAGAREDERTQALVGMPTSASGGITPPSITPTGTPIPAGPAKGISGAGIIQAIKRK